MLQNIEFLLYIKECRSVMPFGLGNCKSTRQLCNDIQGPEEIKRKFYGCFTEKLNTCWDIQTREIQAYFLNESPPLAENQSIHCCLVIKQTGLLRQVQSHSCLRKASHFRARNEEAMGHNYRVVTQHDCSAVYTYTSVYTAIP